MSDYSVKDGMLMDGWRPLRKANAAEQALYGRIKELEALLDEYKDAEHRAVTREGKAIAERDALQAQVDAGLHVLYEWFTFDYPFNELEAALKGERDE